MNLLHDAWLVLQTDRLSVLISFGSVLWGSLVVAAMLSRACRTMLEPAEALALSLGGWIVPVLLCGVVILALGTFLRVWPSPLLIAALMVLAAAWALRSILRAHSEDRPGSLDGVPSLLAIFVTLAFLRLAFASQTLLPMYFDSAEHYRIIRVLMEDYSGTASPAALAWPVRGYYHIGYHVVLAALTVLSHADLGRLMLVSGAIVAAALPIPLYVVTWRETGSAWAGLLAVVLGSLGWYMPAYVLNWGKYPALFGVSSLLFTLTAAYLAGVPRLASPQRRAYWILAIAGACATGAVHTRSMILLVIMIASWMLSAWSLRQPPLRRHLTIALAGLVLAVECVLLDSQGILRLLLDPYLGAGIWITCLTALLAPLAYIRFPRLLLACLLSLIFVLLALLIPSPPLISGTILDRPLVEMVLFVPVTLVGSAGAASLASSLFPRDGSARVAVASLLAATIILNAFVRYSFYPSDCCLRLAGDDLTALAWLRSEPVAGQGRVLIATTELRAAPLPYPPLLPASDAGAWVAPLSGRQTASLPYWVDFSSDPTLHALCAQDVTDIFVGSGPQSFSRESLQEMPAWYIIELRLPQTDLYRVTGCER